MKRRWFNGCALIQRHLNRAAALTMREALTDAFFFTAWMVLHPIKAFRFLAVRLLSLLNRRRPLWDNKAMHPLLRALGFPKPSDNIENLPYMVTITTLTVSGLSDTEIAGY